MKLKGKPVKNVLESKIFHISVSLISAIMLTIITVIIVESVSFIKGSVIQTYVNKNEIKTVMVLVKDHDGRLVCIEKTLKDIVPKVNNINKKTYGISK